ncbi:RidA family protein [Acidaminobacter sp. JC074]|uniref:RidA family protein n=1 Tax=Acidaminobacter sp. JC074 TaxID=2530199 RepID=UPI001F0F26FC|nr:RidA family protein [Acidaminobacter sp. JC074]MCH4886060.1 RidA family protein [Acidaminobacter sp. JC074]
MTIEDRLKDLKINLPEPLEPIGSYIPFKRVGNLIYFSGQGPMWDKVPKYHGKVGRELNKEQGYEAAKLTALNMISQIKNAIGDLDKVKQFVDVTGFINCTDDFIDQPYVLNGFSEMIIEVFGEKGYHSRCAVPSGTLPMDTPVEIKMIVEVYDENC